MTVEGRAEVHRDPPRLRPARLRPTRSSPPSATASAKTALGDPANEATRMGPLASLDQREEVRERIRELSAEAEIVAGDPDERAPSPPATPRRAPS